jgi:hypothetical protein
LDSNSSRTSIDELQDSSKWITRLFVGVKKEETNN